MVNLVFQVAACVLSLEKHLVARVWLDDLGTLEIEDLAYPSAIQGIYI